MSVTSKLNQWAKSAKGQIKMSDCIAQYCANGTEVSASGAKLMPEKRIEEAVTKFLIVLRQTAASYDLPESVMKHIESMDMTRIHQTAKGYEVPLWFGGDLHRDSLENDLGYEGVDNIVAVFNNGYHARNYVYGWWNHHRPSGEALARSNGFEDFAWVRSRKDREALRFIQQAIMDFNGNYGTEYNVIEIAPAKIYEK